jgi:lipopolysaccharide biosynthesis glycosyltransferase
MNHIIQACDKRTLTFALTTAASAAATSSQPIFFHIYSSTADTFEGRATIWIENWKTAYPAHKIETAVIDLSAVENAPRQIDRYTVEVWSKPFIPLRPEFDNVSRVLWLDNDVLVLDDVTTLFNLPSQEMPFFACANLQPMPTAMLQKVDAVKHFNGGVLLFEVPILRKLVTVEDITKIALSGEAGKLHDEFVLSQIVRQKLKPKWLPYARLHARWNVNQLYCLDNSLAKKFMQFIAARTEIAPAIENPAIVHFIHKPWGASRSPALKEYYKTWFKYHTSILGAIRRHRTKEVAVDPPPV